MDLINSGTDEETMVDLEEIDTGHALIDLQPLHVHQDLYHLTGCFMDIGDLISLKHPYRGRNDEWVAELKKKLVEKGFLKTVGVIKVVFLDAVPTATLVIPGTHIKEKVSIADGFHLIEALRELLEDPMHKAKFEELCRALPVTVHVRKDGRAINNREALSLASYYNDSTSFVKRASFRDKVQESVSVLRCLQDAGYKLKELTIASVLKSLDHVQHLKHLQPRTKVRYAQIALNLAVNEEHFKMVMAFLQENNHVGVTHISCNVLLTADDPTFVKFCLLSLKQKLKGRSEVPFETVRLDFFKCVENLYKSILQRCSEDNVDPSKLFEYHVELSDKSTTPFMDWVSLLMTRFLSKRVKSKEGVFQNKLTTVKKKLEEILPNVAPPAPEVPEVTQTISEKSGRNAAAGAQATQDNDVVMVDVGTVADGNEEGVENGGAPASKAYSLRTRGENTSSEPSDARKSLTVQGSGKKRKGKRPPTKKQKTLTPSNGGTASRSSALIGTTRKESQSINLLQSLSKEQFNRVVNRLGYFAVRRRSNSISEPTQPTREFEEATDMFDDEIPAELPCGVLPSNNSRAPVEPPEGKKALKPDDCPYYLNLNMIDKDNKDIFDLHAYLNSACMPPQHRSHVLLNDKKVLFKNQCQLWWSLNRNIAITKSNKEIQSELRTVYTDVDVLPSGNAAKELYSRSLLGDVKGLMKEHEMELKMQGFTIFQGVLEDLPQVSDSSLFKTLESNDESAEELSSSIFPGDRSWAKTLNGHFQKSFSDFIAGGGAGNQFKYIANTGKATDEEEAHNLNGRWQGTRASVVDDLERTDEGVGIAKRKALFEVRVGLLLAMLNLSDQENPQSAMYCPDTGCRPLGSSNKSVRQTFHSDQEIMGYVKTILEERNPGYFIVGTGANPGCLWTVEGSHRDIAKSKLSRLALMSSSKWADLQSIPPLSVFIGRGDLQHAGPASTDFPIFSNDTNVRLHMYCFPKGTPFPNAIHILSDYQPNVRTDTTSLCDSSSSGHDDIPDAEDDEDDEDPGDIGGDDDDDDDDMDDMDDMGRGGVTDRNDDEEEDGSVHDGEDEEEEESEDDDSSRRRKTSLGCRANNSNGRRDEDSDDDSGRDRTTGNRPTTKRPGPGHKPQSSKNTQGNGRNKSNSGNAGTVSGRKRKHVTFATNGSEDTSLPFTSDQRRPYKTYTRIPKAPRRVIKQERTELAMEDEEEEGRQESEATDDSDDESSGSESSGMNHKKRTTNVFWKLKKIKKEDGNLFHPTPSDMHYAGDMPATIAPRSTPDRNASKSGTKRPSSGRVLHGHSFVYNSSKKSSPHRNEGTYTLRSGKMRS